MNELEKEYVELTDKLLELIDQRDNINKQIQEIEKELKNKGDENE